MSLFSVLFWIVLPCIVLSARRLIREDTIDCHGFESQQCLDLVYEYYGLTPSKLLGYGDMQQAMLADAIECHYIYDVCPFYIPPITGLSEAKKCENGTVDFIDDNDEIEFYECNNVGLYSFIPIEELGSNNNASGADIWGYQQLDENGNVNKHYAITCQADGSSIVDITDPLNPNVLAFIVSSVEPPLRNVLWRDVKVYKDWAIVGADTGDDDDHGIQIYNLANIIADAEEYQETAPENATIYNVPSEDVVIYDQVGRCHNVYVDDDIGHLYLFGSMGINGNNCSTGIHIVDIIDPENPEFLGCYDGADYVHDAQCVLYHGPDEKYHGNEICFMFTPTVGNLTVIDITDPEDIIELSSVTYFTSSYNHQGWITSNHEYLLLDDETDEGPLPDRFPKTRNFTTTYIFDITDLENVEYRRAHTSEVLAVDHNQYIVDNGFEYNSNDGDNYRGYTFQANYEAGLRILDISDIANEFGNVLEEIAWFDMYPWKTDSNGSSVYDEIKFFGAWSSYPYFNKLGTKPDRHIYSNKIIVQSTTTGLYVLEFEGDMDFSVPDDGPSDGSGSDFEWDEWYGVLSIIAIIVLALLAIFILSKIIMNAKKKKRMDVYESIIGMEKGPNNNGNYGTTGTAQQTNAGQRM